MTKFTKKLKIVIFLIKTYLLTVKTVKSKVSIALNYDINGLTTLSIASRARKIRDLTVPTGHFIISAISS